MHSNPRSFQSRYFPSFFSENYFGMKRLVAPKRSAIRSVDFENTCLRTGVTPQVQLSILSNVRSSRWVNTRKIEFLLKGLQNSITSLTLSTEFKLKLDENMKSLTAIVQQDPTKKMSLSRLYDEFWKSWRSLKESLNSVLEVDDAPPIVAFCADRMRKIESMIKRGEEKVPEASFSPERFEYVYGKLGKILEMFGNVTEIDLHQVLHNFRAIRNVLTKHSATFFVNDADFQFCVNNLKLVIESVERIQQNDAAKAGVVSEFASCQSALRKLVSADLKEQKQTKPEEKVAKARDSKKVPEKRRMPRYDTPEVEVRPTLSRLVRPKRSVTPPAARVKLALRQVDRGNKRPDADARKARDARRPMKLEEPVVVQKQTKAAAALDLKATSRRCKNDEPKVKVEVEAPKPKVSMLEIPNRRVSFISSDSYNDISDGGPMSRRASSRMEFLHVFHAIRDDDDSTSCDFGVTPRGYHEIPKEEEYEYYSYSYSSAAPPKPTPAAAPAKPANVVPAKPEPEYDYYSD